MLYIYTYTYIYIHTYVTDVDPSVPEPTGAQLAQYVAMDVKEYGCKLGADFAGAT